MAAPKKDPDRKLDQRVPIMMTTAELEAIDDWRAERRIWSRGEAIRQLVTEGLANAHHASRQSKKR